MPGPVCFMVMPFGNKPVPDRGEVDFNALWDLAFAPLLRELGYEPIRADQDLGSSIIADMLIRLTASDLVMADLTLPNANVYYEVGVRHAAREPGCVLIAPDWAMPLFDVAQMRRIAYPLPIGALDDDAIAAIHAALGGPVRRAAEARSPVFDLVPGYPGDLPTDASGRFRTFVGHVSDFQMKAAEIRATPAAEVRAKVGVLVRAYPLDQPQSPAVVLELLRLVRNHLGFAEALDFIDQLPSELAERPHVLEQHALALSQAGRHAEAVARLTAVIDRYGPSPERHGLMGGRYKAMWRKAIADGGDDVDARRALAKAIEHYEAGMWLDLNDYYCAANLPRLLRSQIKVDNELRALQAADISRRACERAQRVGKHDDWLSFTMLGAAFDTGDADVAEQLLDRILDEGPPPWMYGTTLGDLEHSLAGLRESLQVETMRRLEAVVAVMRREANR